MPLEFTSDGQRRLSKVYLLRFFKFPTPIYLSGVKLPRLKAWASDVCRIMLREKEIVYERRVRIHPMPKGIGILLKGVIKLQGKNLFTDEREYVLNASA